MSDYGYAHNLSMSNTERNETPLQSDGNQSTIYGDGFNFDGQVKFNGFVDYMATRSTLFNPKEIVPEKSIWDLKPPDFRHQSYAPKPPKRCTILSQQPWKYGTYPGYRDKQELQQPQAGDVALHPVLKQPRAKSPYFQRRFRIERPWTSRINFVKHGKLPNEPEHYINPKPLEIRTLADIERLGLPEFDTKEEKDPFDLKLQHKFIKTYHGINLEPPPRDLAPVDDSHPRMKLVRPSDPQFEGNLILRKDKWPKGMAYRHSAEYTRHKKLIRTAQSAFMERAHRSLHEKWDRRRKGLPPLDNYEMPRPPSNFVKVI